MFSAYKVNDFKFKNAPGHRKTNEPGALLLHVNILHFHQNGSSMTGCPSSEQNMFNTVNFKTL